MAIPYNQNSKSYVVYDIIDMVDTIFDGPETTKIVKKVFENNEWVEKIFIKSKISREKTEWCHKHYGECVYSVTWWNTFDHNVMSDKIFTHWMLCK